MRAWWEKQSKAGHATMLCALGIGLYVWLGFFLIVDINGIEGRGLPKDNPAYALSKLIVSFFAVYPIWFAIPVLSYMRKKVWVLLMVVGLLVGAFWFTSRELGHSLTLSEAYAGIAYLLSISWEGVYLTALILVLLGFILGLLFLPNKYRLSLFVTGIAVPIAGFILLVSMSFPHP